MRYAQPAVLPSYLGAPPVQQTVVFQGILLHNSALEATINAIVTVNVHSHWYLQQTASMSAVRERCAHAHSRLLAWAGGLPSLRY
jgi:hypothetical protein